MVCCSFNRAIFAAFALGAFAFGSAPKAVAQPTPVRSGLEGVYAERAALVLANDRCRFLSAGAALSAEAGRLLARGSLLRAGRPDSALSALDASVWARVSALACNAATLQTAAITARKSHEAWLATGDSTLPAYRKGWRVRRIATDTWRADQDIGTAGRGVRVGLVEAPGGYAMAISSTNPVSNARLIVRDPSRAGRPALPASGIPIPPPRAITRAFFPASKGPEPFSPYTRPRPPPGTLFQFLPAAREALMALDPREAFEVELVFVGPNGAETTQRFAAEVGDFRAAFLLLSAR